MSPPAVPGLPAAAVPFDPADAVLLGCLDASPAGFGLFDREERLQRANAVFLEAFDAELQGAPTWEALMRSCHRRRRGLLIDAPDIDAWLAKVRRSHRQVPVRTFESDLVDGRWMWVNETVRPDGWLLVVMIDITPLKAHEATLRNARDQAVLASLTDSLTGLYNRRFIFDRLDDLLASARSMRIALSVVMIDLDHFKQINDRHGHGVGDGVLQHFAAQLRRHLRPLDAAGRIGGEEFMLVLPNTTQTGAELAMVRLRQLVRAGAPLPQVPSVEYSFSAGLAEALSGESAAALVKRADLAMYRAKAQGRDCHVAADAAPAAPPPA